MSPLDATKRPAAQILLVIAVGLLCLWQFHIPQFASQFDIFPGDRGDARLVAYIMEHWYHVFHNVSSWRSPPMFYPVQGTIGYADLMLGYGVVYSGLRTLGLGIFESAEFTIILFNFLNYLVCFILLNKVLRLNLLASIAGATFFAYNNAKLVQLGHLQLQPILFLPLALIGVVLLVQKRDRLSQQQAFGLIALTVLSLALQLLTGFYSGWFFIFWAGVFLLLTLLFARSRKIVLDVLRRFWPALLAGIAVFTAALIPFVVAYLPIVRSIGGRPYVEIESLIPVPLSFFVMGQRNYLWGGISEAIQARHPMSPELQIGIGLVPSLVWLALVVFAVGVLIRMLRGSQVASRNLFLAQSIIASCLIVLIGMRYGNHFSPWQFVYSFVPGAQAIRGVSRYALVLALPMAIAFAHVIHFAIERISRVADKRRRAVLFGCLLVLIGLGLVEQFGRKEGFDGFSISAENLYLNRVAQGLPNDCSSFYVAVKPAALHNQFEYQIDAIFVSMMKGMPTLNGYSGQLPPGWNLWEVMDPSYVNNVKQWIELHQIKGNICRLFINETTAANDIADPDVFIRQQYLDILGREPDQPGFQMWLARLNGCARQGGRGADRSCDRISVSLGILNSDEFLQRDDFVLRAYVATLGRRPLYEEFLKDRASLVATPTADLDSAKQAFLAELVQRPDFNWKTEFDYPPATRAQVLQTVLDDQKAINGFRNQTLVLIQFFANLNRDPQPWEYKEHLNRLNATGDYRQLVSDFLYSAEYRKRFGYVN